MPPIYTNTTAINRTITNLHHHHLQKTRTRKFPLWPFSSSSSSVSESCVIAAIQFVFHITCLRFFSVLQIFSFFQVFVACNKYFQFLQILIFLPIFFSRVFSGENINEWLTYFCVKSVVLNFQNFPIRHFTFTHYGAGKSNSHTGADLSEKVALNIHFFTFSKDICNFCNTSVYQFEKIDNRNSVIWDLTNPASEILIFSLQFNESIQSNKDSIKSAVVFWIKIGSINWKR